MVSGVSLFGGKNTLQKRFGTKDSVRCSEFRGGRFPEVANVLQVWDFQSVTRTLSALGSVSASRSVRSGRFYCISLYAIYVSLPLAKLLYTKRKKTTKKNITFKKKNEYEYEGNQNIYMVVASIEAQEAAVSLFIHDVRHYPRTVL